MDAPDSPPGLPLVPPEDQPLDGTPGSPRRTPRWTIFLTPGAVLLGALVVAGAVWLSRADDDAVPAAAPAAADPAPGLSSSDATAEPRAGSRPVGLLDAFLGYGTEVGLDIAPFQECLLDGDGSLISTHLRRGAEFEVSGTPTFFINNKKVVGSQPAAIFREVIQRELDGSPSSLDAYSPAVQALAATTPPRFEIIADRPDVSDATIDGSPSARVMVAEFSDFQCPFCRRWNEETLGVVRPLLGEDVALAFLHFPIVSIHPNAGNASLAAICAGRQGKFWEMHDLLFANQQEWQSLGTN